MTRVHHRSAKSQSRRNPSKSGSRNKRSYKIVLESVTQEKKKLISSVSYSAQAPPGYTFVPAGTPDLTQHCIELCRKRGLAVFNVSATPRSRAHANPDKISHHLHRIGFHFPTEVVDQACDWLGYSGHGRGYRRAVDVVGTSRLARSLANHNRQETKQQIRSAIRDLFPKIPDSDLEAIVEHAFREGTARVGNATDLSLSRRVQLAVVAHIRHTYTDYDNLLRSGTYLEARSKVERACLEQLVKWRGEEESSSVELEDVFREIIVIDDEDDDSEGSESDTSSDNRSDDRENSLEIISSQIPAHDVRVDESDHVEWIDNHTDRTPRRVYFLRPRTRQPNRVQFAPRVQHSRADIDTRFLVDREALRGSLSASQASKRHDMPPLVAQAEHRLLPAQARNLDYSSSYTDPTLDPARPAKLPAQHNVTGHSTSFVSGHPSQGSEAVQYIHIPSQTHYSRLHRFPQSQHDLPPPKPIKYEAPQHSREDAHSMQHSLAGPSHNEGGYHQPQEVVLPSIETDQSQPPSTSADVSSFMTRVSNGFWNTFYSHPSTVYPPPTRDYSSSNSKQLRIEERPPLIPKRKSWPLPQLTPSGSDPDYSTLKRQRVAESTDQAPLLEPYGRQPERITHVFMENRQTGSSVRMRQEEVIDLTSSRQQAHRASWLPPSRLHEERSGCRRLEPSSTNGYGHDVFSTSRRDQPTLASIHAYEEGKAPLSRADTSRSGFHTHLHDDHSATREARQMHHGIKPAYNAARQIPYRVQSEHVHRPVLRTETVAQPHSVSYFAPAPTRDSDRNASLRPLRQHLKENVQSRREYIVIEDSPSNSRTHLFDYKSPRSRLEQPAFQGSHSVVGSPRIARLEPRLFASNYTTDDQASRQSQDDRYAMLPTLGYAPNNGATRP